MDWYCIYTPMKIRINFGSKFKGYYEFLTEPFCHNCSSPDVKTEDCILNNFVYGFDRIYSLGKYIKGGPPYDFLSSHIRGLKDKKFENYSKPLGWGLYLFIQNKYPELLKADLIVPIPAHENKVKNRGFNQSELISNVFGEYSGIKSLNCLKQIKDTELRDLTLTQRYEVVKGMFAFSEDHAFIIKNKHILLIDDVVTSAATISECASILKQREAKRVDGLSLGRTKLDDNG